MNTRRRLTLVDLDVTIISGEATLALTSVIIDLIDACSYQVHGHEMILFLSVNYIKLYILLTLKRRSQLVYSLYYRYKGAYLSNTLTNLRIALHCILLYCVVLSCIVLLIYCYEDITQYPAMHKFVRVLENPPKGAQGRWEDKGRCE